MLEGAVVDVTTILEGHEVLFLLIPGAVDEPHPVGGGLVSTIDIEGPVIISLDLVHACVCVCAGACVCACVCACVNKSTIAIVRPLQNFVDYTFW